MENYDFSPLLLTLKLASLTTLILLIVCLPVAYWLAHSRNRFRFIAEALVNTPLVLPPSVLGFYLLLVFSTENGLGKFLKENFDLQLVFTFEGLILGSVIFSFPFMVQPLQSGFQGLPLSLREASYTLGKSKTVTLFRVLLPNMKPAVLSGIVLSFAHTVGEFGVVLMIGGNIPGITRVASIAVYDEVEALNYSMANFYSLILFLLSFLLLAVFYAVNHKISSTIIR